MRSILLSLILLGIWGICPAQLDYDSPAEVNQRLTALASKAPQLATLKTIATTPGGNPIHVLEIGSQKDNPAVAIIGGSDGDHLLGTELAVRFAEHLITNRAVDSIDAILNHTTFYIFPLVNPDARSTGRLVYERTGNARSTDNDRDGRTDEDGFEDLNGDGRITMMRIESPAGQWMPHPADSRVLIKADASKGEKGKYLLYSEGKDNDGDEEFNEDGPGGVSFNRNLTFKYPHFSAEAGPHAVSEPETQAVLDYLYDRWNTYAVVNFGHANNLSKANKYSKSDAKKRVVASWLEKDITVNEMVSKLYNEHVSASDWDASPAEGGDVTNWAYYHYGRYAFSTPGWKSGKFELPKDSVEAAKYIKNEDENAQVDYLRWAETNNYNLFSDWTAVSYPERNEKVEVGGFLPYTLNNPVTDSLEAISSKHNNFLVRIAESLPKIEVQDFKSESLGNGIHRITLTVYNSGAMPTMSELGAKNQWVKRVKAALKLKPNQQLISGNRVQFLPRMENTSIEKLTWLVSGNGKVDIELGAPHTGIQNIDITLN